MRTTLTIDPDVARLLEDEVHRSRQPFKRVVNDAIRRGLSPRRTPAERRYTVKPHPGRPRPGIDVERLNALADELDDRAILGAGRPRQR